MLPNPNKRPLLRRFKEADPEFLMSAEERKQLAELDDNDGCIVTNTKAEHSYK